MKSKCGNIFKCVYFCGFKEMSFEHSFFSSIQLQPDVENFSLSLCACLTIFAVFCSAQALLFQPLSKRWYMSELTGWRQFLMHVLRRVGRKIV